MTASLSSDKGARQTDGRVGKRRKSQLPRRRTMHIGTFILTMMLHHEINVLGAEVALGHSPVPAIFRFCSQQMASPLLTDERTMYLCVRTDAECCVTHSSHVRSTDSKSSQVKSVPSRHIIKLNCTRLEWKFPKVRFTITTQDYVVRIKYGIPKLPLSTTICGPNVCIALKRYNFMTASQYSDWIRAGLSGFDFRQEQKIRS
jgi:hypothetical protein